MTNFYNDLKKGELAEREFYEVYHDLIKLKWPNAILSDECDQHTFYDYVVDTEVCRNFVEIKSQKTIDNNKIVVEYQGEDLTAKCGWFDCALDSGVNIHYFFFNPSLTICYYIQLDSIKEAVENNNNWKIDGGNFRIFYIDLNLIDNKIMLEKDGSGTWKKKQ